MTSPDCDPAAPPPEPEDAAADWMTEESVTEPEAPPPSTRRADAIAGDTPPSRSAPRAAPAPEPERPPRPATPQPPAEPAAPSWLASAQGLVPPVPRAADAGGAPTVDFEVTRVHPRAQQRAEDWGWQPAEDVAAPPAFPSVPARTASPSGWVPFDPEAAAQPRTWSQPVSARTVVEEDPYRRRELVGQPVVAGRAPVWDDRFDPVDRSTAQARRGFPWRRLVFSFILGLILSAVVAGGAIYAYEQQYADRILPNVHVGSVDVSGLTRDAAHDRLAEAYQGYGQGTVRVSLAGATTEIPYADFDRRPDIDAMVDAAFGIGRAASPVDRLLGELRTVTKGATVTPTVVLDADKLAQRVHDIAQAAEWQPVDAGAVVTNDGFATTPSKAGQSVDEGTAAADAAAQLTSIDAPDTIDLTLTATTIPPKVSDTSAQLAAKQAALMQNDVVLQDGTETWVIPAATVHQWLTFTIINNRVRIAIDTKAVLAELKPLSEKIDRTAVNATVKLSGAKVVFDKPSVDGRTFNASKTTTAVVNGLRNRAQGTLAIDAPIPPVLALVKPALTTDEAKAAIPLMKQISSWTTNYQASDRNGNGANIRIPTTTINGYVVAPGETFSFWKAVGPVTRELGYTDGGAIIDGHTEPQGALGGGICSCSTTLFNAALRAGFAMGDRLNHFYYINRYPLGLDATVFISASGQAQDMSWTNDTDYPVVIQGINGKGTVKFVLYSVPNGRTTTFSDPVVKNYTKAHTETRVDKSIPRGTRKQIEYATDGQDVTVVRTVKDKDGKVLHKETYYSHYATITGIILTNP
jgi:vancomycin resistance protein YoaR